MVILKVLVTETEYSSICVLRGCLFAIKTEPDSLARLQVKKIMLLHLLIR